MTNLKVDQLDIRGYFSAMAMQGILSSVDQERWNLSILADSAVRQSDALIAELNK